MAGQTFAWITVAATILFLSLCARHNRRTGYTKIRNAESAVEDLAGWLHAVRAAIRSPGAAASVQPLPQVALTQKQSEQLLSLNNALLEQSSSSVPETETEAVAARR